MIIYCCSVCNGVIHGKIPEDAFMDGAVYSAEVWDEEAEIARRGFCDCEE